jgi:hypothetical protein
VVSRAREKKKPRRAVAKGIVRDCGVRFFVLQYCRIALLSPGDSTGVKNWDYCEAASGRKTALHFSWGTTVPETAYNEENMFP